MNRGFTLVEILIAILIMAVLVVMAVPMYEKAIEKSRIAQARVELKRIYDAKRRVQDNLERETYQTTDFGFENLDYSVACTSTSVPEGQSHQTTCETDDFTFFLLPAGTNNENFVCAVRRTGDYAGVNFLYKGEEVSGDTEKFLCNNGGVTNGCEVYGLDATAGTAWCAN